MKSLWLVWVWIAAVFVLNISARAQVTHPPMIEDPAYFEIANVESKLVEIHTESLTPKKLNEAYERFQAQRLQLESVERVDQGLFFVNPYLIAQVLLKAWDIVVQNKPVVNVEAKNVSALPVMADYSWNKLTGWKRERVVKYSLSVKNLYGTETVKMDYLVRLLYGGGVAGRGQYIASARVVPRNVKVLWGYNLDVNVNVPSVVNISREDDPIAAVTLEVAYTIKSQIMGFTIKKSSTQDTYLLQGDGLLMDKSHAKVFFEADEDHIPAPPLPSPTPDNSGIGDGGLPTDPTDPFPVPAPSPSPTPVKKKPN